MEKKAWNQNLVVVGLTMLVVVMSMTTKPASAKMGEVRRYQKISEESGGVPDLDLNDRFSPVAGIGDLDGDGVRDIAVGAGADDDGDGDDSGAVYVLFMNTNGTVKRYQKISEASGNGPELDTGDRFGGSVAGIGDLDGDGDEDIAVGAFLDDDGDGDDSGAVYVLFMNTRAFTIFYSY